MKEAIKRQDLNDEYFFAGEECFVFEASNVPEDPQASIARIRVEPGGRTRWHRLQGTVERYYILEGRGLVEVGEIPPTEIGAGDVVLVPPMCRQRIENIGSGDLVFLAICTPRFLMDAYEII